MNAKTGAERVQALRQHRKRMGLVRLELWVLPEDVERIKKYADNRTRASVKASGKPMTDRIYGALAIDSNERDNAKEDQRG